MDQFRRICAILRVQQRPPVISAMRFECVNNSKRNIPIPTRRIHMKSHLPRQVINRSIHTSFTSSNASRAGRVSTRKIRISTNLTLAQTPDKKLNTQDNNPLVMFFPWLGSTPGAIDKYCELYHQKGWDVLIVNATAKHFLWPPNAKVIVKDVLDYVMSKEVQDERTDFFVHSMSIGAFIYTVLFIDLQEQPDKYREVRNKLRGQIFDSIVIGGLKHMGKGVAASITSNPIGDISIRGLMSVYLSLTRKYTVDYYDYSVKFFHEKPITVPTLIYYSIDDEFSDPNAMENLIGTWRAEYPKMDVTYKCWSRSVHTGHLRLHEHEYVSELTHFLTKLELIDDTVHVKSNL